MTLYNKIAVAQDAVVFSGDKRLSDAKGENNNNVKATKLGTNGVGGALGHTRAIQPDGEVIQRDAHEWLRDFFQERDVNHGSIEEFKQHLRKKYQKYLDDHRGGKEPEGVDCVLFNVFMTYFEDNKQFDCLVSAHVKTGSGLNATHQLFKCKASTLILQGDRPIVDAVRSLRSAPLTAIYEHDDVRALLTGALDFNSISVARAIEICQLVNRVCSEQYKAITGKDSTISPNCDVLVLDKTGVYPA